MYIGDWMERGERYFPNALAVVDVAKATWNNQGRFSYRDLNARANRLASYLRNDVGVGPGDRVAMLAMNGVEVVDTFFACGKLGAIFVPLNFRSHARELIELCAQTTPKALIFSDDFAANAAQLKPECPSISHYLHLEGPGIEGSTPYESTLMNRPLVQVHNERVEAEDIICLLFTGGTTGTPKGAQISYRMIAWNTLNTLIHELQRGDVTITHTPMFHTGGLLVYTLPLLTLGGTVVIMRKWTAKDMLSLIEKERVTALFCVPTQFQMMMEEPTFASTSFKSVRYLTSGGAPLPVPVIRAYAAQHSVVFKQGFGMTEFGPGIFSLAPEYAESKAGSIGKPNYFIEARIVDDENKPVTPGEVGELILKGPSMSSGYFNNPEASRAAIDMDGFFHTGDMARMDSEGFYYIADRKKDMFISGGENVYPVEIEKALYEHPAVLQCAVIGIPDEKWGEVGKAFIVKRSGMEASDTELLEHCKARLAKYKIPKAITFMDALPVSAAGKILKRELKNK